jgi:hypothetical protein
MAIDTKGVIVLTTTALTGVVELVGELLNINFFGIPNLLLFLVILNVLVDAYFGVRRSIKESKEALVRSYELDPSSPEYRKEIKIYNLKKFKTTKLQFTFFKCVTLLGYLFFIKHLITIDSTGFLGGAIGFTSELLLKAPVAIFWYHDFKSIGDNTEHIFGKKAPIFTIVENILEFRINKFYNKS